MDKQDFETLVSLTDKLDTDGHVAEAAALDLIITKVAALVKEAEDDSNAEARDGMSGKAQKACESLLRTLESFCGKNLDSRGPNRRKMNKICDAAEDLRDDLKGILGS